MCSSRVHPPVWETQVQSLGWEVRNGSHASVLAWAMESDVTEQALETLRGCPLGSSPVAQGICPGGRLSGRGATGRAESHRLPQNLGEKRLM